MKIKVNHDAIRQFKKRKELPKPPEVPKDMRSIEAMIDKLGDHPTVTNNSVADKPAEIITKADKPAEIIIAKTVNAQQRSFKKAKHSEIPDVVAEQMETSPYQTAFCPEAETDLKIIKKNPEEFIEINMVRTSRVVDTFCIRVDEKNFTYKKRKYPIKQAGIYLMPTKTGLLMPTSFYREDHDEPAVFKNTNKGITGRALTLLYKQELYQQILYAENPKYNLFIVILLIANLITFGIGCYIVFGGG